MPIPIGNAFVTQIPALDDAANIQTALKNYHYGLPPYPDTDSAVEINKGIAGLLKARALVDSPTFTGNANFGGDVTVGGNLVIQGDTTTLNTSTLTVEDKNIELGKVATPTDITADTGGITLKGSTDKTFNWLNATDSWTSSESIDLASGKTFNIAGTTALSATEVLGIAKTSLVTLAETQSLSNKTFTGTTSFGRIIATSPGAGSSGGVTIVAPANDGTGYFQMTNNANNVQWLAIGATAGGVSYSAGSAGNSPHTFNGKLILANTTVSGNGVAGTLESDGNVFYATPKVNGSGSGRGVVDSSYVYVLPYNMSATVTSSGSSSSIKSIFDNLYIPLAANTIYQIEMNLKFYSQVSAPAGQSYASTSLTFSSATGTIITIDEFVSNASGSTTNEQAYYQGNAYDYTRILNSVQAGATNKYTYMKVSGTIKTGSTAGNFAPIMGAGVTGSGSSSSATCYIYGQSFIKITPLGPVSNNGLSVGNWVA